jgi:hypothetical protein
MAACLDFSVVSIYILFNMKSAVRRIWQYLSRIVLLIWTGMGLAYVQEISPPNAKTQARQQRFRSIGAWLWLHGIELRLWAGFGHTGGHPNPEHLQQRVGR